MLSASSSATSSFLSQYFGTSSSNSTTSSGVGLDDGSSSPDYVLDGSLGSDNFSADFLSNAEFAQDTEALLLNPHLNGAIGGVSSNVQKIITQIEGSLGITPASTDTASTASSSSAPATSSATPTTTDGSTTALPSGGILA